MPFSPEMTPSSGSVPWLDSFKKQFPYSFQVHTLHSSVISQMDPHSSQLGTSWKYGRVLVGSRMFTSYSGQARDPEVLLTRETQTARRKRKLRRIFIVLSIHSVSRYEVILCSLVLIFLYSTVFGA